MLRQADRRQDHGRQRVRARRERCRGGGGMPPAPATT